MSIAVMESLADIDPYAALFGLNEHLVDKNSIATLYCLYLQPWFQRM